MHVPSGVDGNHNWISDSLEAVATGSAESSSSSLTNVIVLLNGKPETADTDAFVSWVV
jgi:hypothetical protein